MLSYHSLSLININALGIVFHWFPWWLKNSTRREMKYDDLTTSFTMDVYSHIIEGMQDDTMALLDEVLPVGVSQKNAKLTPILPKVGTFS